jgi:hypothetical protein
MALPTIVFNSAGSDTLASGAGPATAVTGTLAATASTTAVTITDAVALGGVATDGSAALWVATSSGRRWSRITAISGSSGAWTVTVADAYGVTASAQSWAIGGQRATLAGSLQLGADCRSGWTIDVQTDQVLTANFNLAPNAVNNQWTAFTCSQATRATISTSTNSVWGLDVQNANNLVISHLHFKSTAASPGSGIGPASFNTANYVTVQDCVIEGFAHGILDHDTGGNINVNAMIITACEVKGCTTDGINLWAGAQVAGCYVHGNAANMTLQGIRAPAVNVVRSIFDSATAGHGVNMANAGGTGALFDHCVFSNNTSTGTASGLQCTSTTGFSLVVRNSIFYGNKTYGIGGSTSNLEAFFATNCAFGSNIAGAAQAPFTTGVNPITLTANPFHSSTDFGLNNTGGGGALCRGAGATIPNASALATPPDVGAVLSGNAGGAAAYPVVGAGPAFVRGFRS